MLRAWRSVRAALSRLVGGLRDDRGSVTAEFAVVLPAVVMVLGLSISAVSLSSHRLVLSSAAAEVARLEARGDGAVAAARLAQLGIEVGAQRSTRGPLHCVTLSSAPLGGLLSRLEVSSRGCAAKSEAP